MVEEDYEDDVDCNYLDNIFHDAPDLRAAKKEKFGKDKCEKPFKGDMPPKSDKLASAPTMPTMPNDGASLASTMVSRKAASAAQAAQMKVNAIFLKLDQVFAQVADSRFIDAIKEVTVQKLIDSLTEGKDSENSKLCATEMELTATAGRTSCLE